MWLGSLFVTAFKYYYYFPITILKVLVVILGENIH